MAACAMPRHADASRQMHATACAPSSARRCVDRVHLLVPERRRSRLAMREECEMRSRESRRAARCDAAAPGEMRRQPPGWRGGCR